MILLLFAGILGTAAGLCAGWPRGAGWALASASLGGAAAILLAGTFLAWRRGRGPAGR